MNRTPLDAGLNEERPHIGTTGNVSESVRPSAAPRPASRQGRKQIAGFFSPDMSFAMHTLARRQGRNLQALMTEAFNDVLHKHGENTVGD